MEKVTIQLYSVDELSKKAFEKAYLHWCSTYDYDYGTDNEKVLEKFQEIFPVKITGYSYGGGREYISFVMNCHEIIAQLSGVRLLKYIWNNYKDYIFNNKIYYNGIKKRKSKIKLNCNCVLTGYYLDYDILEPIYKFLNNPKKDITFEDLIEKCLNNWLNACQKDYENFYSEEYFREIARMNRWLYYKNGDLFEHFEDLCCA